MSHSRSIPVVYIASSRMHSLDLAKRLNARRGTVLNSGPRFQFRTLIVPLEFVNVHISLAVLKACQQFNVEMKQMSMQRGSSRKVQRAGHAFGAGWKICGGSKVIPVFHFQTAIADAISFNRGCRANCAAVTCER